MAAAKSHEPSCRPEAHRRIEAGGLDGKLVLCPDLPSRRDRAVSRLRSGNHPHMNQWIGAVNSYYYPYMIYHVSHERNVFPQLGIEPDEKVVELALPKVEVCLQVMERELADGKEFMLGPQLSLADFYLLPIIHAFGFAPEAQAIYPRFPSICAWRERMEALPTLKRFRAAQPPRGPIEHARRWAVSHRPKY